MNDTLREFLEGHGLPKIKSGKKSKGQLGVSDPKLGGAIKVSCFFPLCQFLIFYQEGLSIDCVSNEQVLELIRGIRIHLSRFIKGLEQGDLERSQVHSFPLPSASLAPNFWLDSK